MTFARISDIVMCIAWSLAYLMAVISTIKNHKSPIPPLATILCGVQELGIFASLIANKNVTGYVFATYTVWVILDPIVFSILHIKYKLIQKRFIAPYFIALIGGSIGYFFLVMVPNGMLYGNYGFSIVANVLVLIATLKRKQFDEVTIMFLAFKLIADTFAIFMYFDVTDWIVSTFSIVMPTIDLVTLIIGFRKYWINSQD